MGKRTSYPPGTFSWVDLATTYTAAAKSFYAGLFGWEMEDNDADGAVYTTCRIEAQPYIDVGGTTPIDRNVRVRIDTRLPKGKYVLLCFIPDAEGTSHLKLGMVHPFTVR
jgi:hypothetical protein